MKYYNIQITITLSQRECIEAKFPLSSLRIKSIRGNRGQSKQVLEDVHLPSTNRIKAELFVSHVHQIIPLVPSTTFQQV